MKKHSINGLYGITPDWNNTAALLTKTEQILLGGARLIQYRNKTADMALRHNQAELLVQLCRTFNTPLIINDCIDLAIAVDADGVHIGEHDEDVATARRLLGASKIIGVSCYNRLELAIQAEANGANYVAFGAFYPTTTKQNTVTAPINILERAKKILAVPVVGIGGIKISNATYLINSGANAIAVSNTLYQVKDPRRTAEKLTRFFD